MIEAVNSVLQNAPLVRPSAEQTSTIDSFAANPDRVQKVPQAPFVSPFIFVDVELNRAILQIRDSETGDVIGQFSKGGPILDLPDFLPEEKTTAPEQTSADVPTPAITTPTSESIPSSPEVTETVRINAETAQKLAAFAAAAQSGNTNSGNVTLTV